MAPAIAPPHRVSTPVRGMPLVSSDAGKWVAAVDTVKCLPKAQTKFTGTATQRNTVEMDCVDNQVTTDGGDSPPTGKVTALCGGGPPASPALS